MTKIRLMHRDNMEFMASIPDKFYELAICDPEYGLDIASAKETNVRKGESGVASKKDYKKKDWDKSVPSYNYFSELFRISKNQIIWGANYFGLVGGYIFWDKEVTMPTFSKGELAYCSLINKVEYFKYAWHGMIQKDMKNKEIRVHPTQKPVALYKWLLQNYATKGDKILDTHGGSMSIAIACADYGYDLDLCELDADYYRDGVNRVKNHLKQSKMFGEQIELILT